MAYQSKVLSLKELSALPDKLKDLKDQRSSKVTDYQDFVTGLLTAITGKDLNQAHSLSGRADRLEHDVDNITAEIKQCQAELQRLVDEKIKVARTMFNKLGKSRSAQISSAADYLLKAKKSCKNKDLAAALLQAQQCITLLQRIKQPTRQRMQYNPPTRQKTKIIRL